MTPVQKYLQVLKENKELRRRNANLVKEIMVLKRELMSCEHAINTLLEELTDALEQ